jgi:hypothetical protein
LPGIQLVKYALQLFKLLPRLAEPAFRGQVLVLREVFGQFRDESIDASPNTILS